MLIFYGICQIFYFQRNGHAAHLKSYMLFKSVVSCVDFPVHKSFQVYFLCKNPRSHVLVNVLHFASVLHGKICPRLDVDMYISKC